MADRVLVCTTPFGDEIELPTDAPHTRPIMDLLANDTNTKLTLTKWDGTEYVYEMREPRG